MQTLRFLALAFALTITASAWSQAGTPDFDELANRYANPPMRAPWHL